MTKANSPSSAEKQTELIDQISAKAENLFLSGQLWCSEAVLVTLNQGLGGGLPPGLAEGLTAGMGEGLGGSGCLCGAVNGAVVALGLFLAGGEPSKRFPAKIVRAHAKELENAFKTRFGGTCCRILTKKDKLAKQSKRQRCAEQTAFAAAIAAKIILTRRPKLVQTADLAYLNQRQNRAGTFLKMIRGK
jgi:C_GCAxxG_C_C family probable redox protein